MEPFNFWRIPGRKLLAHDGERLIVNTLIGCHTVRIAMSKYLEAGMPYTYAAQTALSNACARWRTLQQALTVLDAANNNVIATTLPRPNRGTLTHMRSLQALDGVHAGVSQRDIADVMFCRDDVAQRWHADSELRAQIRHLIKRGRALVQGDYRRLLHSKYSLHRR